MSTLPARSRPILVTSAAIPMPRPHVAVAADGQRAVMSGPDGARQIELFTSAATTLCVEPVRFAACFRDETWIVTSMFQLHRFDRAGTSLGEPMTLPEAPDMFAARGAEPGLVASTFSAMRTQNGVVVVARNTTAFAAVPLDATRIVEQRADGVWLRLGNGSEMVIVVPPDVLKTAHVVGAAFVLAGNAIALELRGNAAHYLLVSKLRGGLLWRLRLVDIGQVQIAESCDRAVALRGDSELVEIDLRLGRPQRVVKLARASVAIGVDGSAQQVVAISDDGEIEVVALAEQVRRRTITEEIAAPAPPEDRESSDTELEPDDEVDARPAGAIDAAPTIVGFDAKLATDFDPRQAGSRVIAPPYDHECANGCRTSAASPDKLAESGASNLRRLAPRSVSDATLSGGLLDRRETVLPDIEPEHDRAMRAILGHVRLRRLERPDAGEPLDDDERAAYLADWRTLVAAWCRRAAAEAWDRGRISADRGPLPFATELDALLGEGNSLAPARVVAARAAEVAAVEQFETWSRDGAPHVELARELGLEPIAVSVLQVAAALALWGEMARAYAIIGNDPSRAACDELTVAQLLGLDDVQRAALARALDISAPLVAHGIIQLGAGRRPFREIVVAPAIVRRLAGEPPPDGEPGLLAVHDGAPALEELRLPARAIELVTSLSRAGATPRIVLRGRAGSGRRTLAAALAARADRKLGMIDVGDEAHLVAALQGAHLRGWLACVSGLDRVDDAALRARLYDVIARHPDPVFLRMAEDTTSPHDPNALVLEMPIPELADRTRAWADALASAGHSREAAGILAARFAVGPGTMHRAIAQLAPDDDVTQIASSIRQLRASRIGAVASRVTSLASWESVVLPPEIAATARDFVARVRHRSTVLDGWGLHSIAASARGATALLQGGPGTGKTLLAGAIARDLGYELYRVDISRVMSKWLGETEKNLSAVFDAAEEGECVLLFDEADALFTKRTEVKSSNDRYANVEVDYLLQRLDAFTGVAVLTTNFGTSIDPAFRRRLALNLTLPFPDVDQRTALWRAHLPAGVPVDPAIDLVALATRYPMSGGYIRNAALRAAFRAADSGGVIDTTLLVGAIEAEYRDNGRLDAIGVLE